jgi:hypothetical protein
MTFGFLGLTFLPFFPQFFSKIDQTTAKVCVPARFTREATCFKTNIIITHHRMKQQELCEKTTSESCPQRRTNLLDVVKSTRKDLEHLREYGLKVEQNLFLLNPYHNASQPWPEDILRIRANIYKQRHLHSKAIAKQNNRRHRGKQQQPQGEMTTTSSKSTNTANTFSCAQSEETFSGSFGAAVKQQQQHHHYHRHQQQGTKPLTIDAETNTYLNNSYAFNLAQLESCAMNVDKFFTEDKHQCDEDQRHHHRHPPPPSSKNTTTTNKKTKMMHTMTSGVSCEHSSASGVDFFNIATPTFNNNNKNKDGGSLEGTKRKKPTSSAHGTRSKLSKRAAANNMKKRKANKEASNTTSNTTPANSAIPTLPVQMLNMDAIFGINGSVENDDDDTALSPNSLVCGCAIASLSIKRM